MAKIIKYFLPNKWTIDSFSPAKKNIPEWYKEIPKGEETAYKVEKNVKNCMPFLDALSAGYFLTTTQEFRITQQEEGEPIWQWNIPDPTVLQIKKRETNHIPVPSGYDDIPLVWETPHTLQVPDGYSLLFTHPLNRYDLPFISLSGVVDADYGLHGGSYPFFLKKGFEGIIPVGTPFAQIIPIKRENWQSEYDSKLEELHHRNFFLSNRYIKNWYKNNVWQKKNYE